VRYGAAELGEEVYVGLRRWVLDLWEDLRTRDQFFQWKACILAGWLVLSFTCLAVARSGGASPADNSLRAYASITRTSMSWGLLVHNQSSKPWTKVEVVLEGGYVHRRDRLEPDERVVISPSQFRLGEATASQDQEPAAVEIRCKQGNAKPALVTPK
jgi:hypothetical protein